MDDRFDHPHHHHHHRYSDDDDQPPPPFPPPSSFPPPPRPDFPPYSDYPPPPPPPPFSSYDDQPPPPPSFSSYGEQRPVYQPPEHVSSVYHTSHQGSESHYSHPPESSVEYAHHESYVSDEPEDRHRFRPHMPAFIESHIHGHSQQSEGSSGVDLSSRPSVKVYCKAETNHMLAIREGKVILARSDHDDPTQHWVKDEKFSTKVKDQDGFPSFALVNKATGQAVKHSIGATHPVQLIEYNPDVLDESVLWTLGKDLGSGYRQIRMVNNTRLVFDAFNGDKNHGGVHDGTTIVLWEPGKGDNQRWQITPYCKPLSQCILFTLPYLFFLSLCFITTCRKCNSSDTSHSDRMRVSCHCGHMIAAETVFVLPFCFYDVCTINY